MSSLLAPAMAGSSTLNQINYEQYESQTLNFPFDFSKLQCQNFDTRNCDPQYYVCQEKNNIKTKQKVCKGNENTFYR